MAKDWNHFSLAEWNGFTVDDWFGFLLDQALVMPEVLLDRHLAFQPASHSSFFDPAAVYLAFCAQLKNSSFDPVQRKQAFTSAPKENSNG